MGLPTRLHGIAFVDLPKAVDGFCPTCTSITTWQLVFENEGEKVYKICEGCKKQKREIKEAQLIILAEKEKARKLEAEAQKKEDAKK